MHSPLPSSDSQYQPFSLKAAKELAAPQTWSASVATILVGGALVYACKGAGFGPAAFTPRALLVWLLMLLATVLMQAAINTFNDYRDFGKGTDSVETIVDETDAAIVYHHLDPKSALHFGVGLLLVAAVFGLAVVALSNWVTLVWGAVAVLGLLAYAFGPKPLSDLPVGEVVSGVWLGGITVWATFYAMTLAPPPTVIFAALPMIIFVGLIMLMNNTQDIERDREAGRLTLAGVLGWRASTILMVVCGVFAYVCLATLVLWQAALGAWPVWLLMLPLFGLIWSAKGWQRMLQKGNYTPELRSPMMGLANIMTYKCGIVMIVTCVLGGLL
ncbi:MAG: prenyltransferase [Coriobacteriales bacterium]|jgi:1,4-dihydroxy-2-naphthoate octaprenyltransferase|nr:prenyltransferase [Coriobacteriales bacterium]